jgi:hypothetical protein
MTIYTPEPWFVHPEQPDTITNREDGEGWGIAICDGDDHEQESANARRIVACVNACRGIATGALEADLVRRMLDAAREGGAT